MRQLISPAKDTNPASTVQQEQDPPAELGVCDSPHSSCRQGQAEAVTALWGRVLPRKGQVHKDELVEQKFALVVSKRQNLHRGN